MTGKEKCNSLKAIRKAFADKNGIFYEPEECLHIGDCLGICPKCEAEAAHLVEQLREKDTIVPMEDKELLLALGNPNVIFAFDPESETFNAILTNEDKHMGGIDLSSIGGFA